VNVHSQSLEELESRYIEKATALEADYKKKSISLAKSYVKALEVKKVEYTKKGDLDKALEIRKKIERMKAIINKEDKTTKTPKQTTDMTNIVGKWYSTYKKTDTFFFNSDGTITLPNKKVAKYKIHTDGTFSLAWPGKGFVAHHTVSEDGKSLLYKGVVFAVRKD
jgi:hypothetical protein